MAASDEPAATVIRGASIGGSHHENQDRWGALPEVGIAWVLDGVTQPEEHRFAIPVARFVEAASAAIGRAAAALPTAPLPTLLGSALEDLAAQPEARHGHRATLALARRDAGGTDWLLLCDAAVLAPQALHRDLRLMRTPVFNRDGGYWILDGATPAAAGRAVTGRIEGPEPVVIMSDGPVDALEEVIWADLAAMRADLVGAADDAAMQALLKGLWRRLHAERAHVDDLTAVVL